jgi:hypothetical protein
MKQSSQTKSPSHSKTRHVHINSNYAGSTPGPGPGGPRGSGQRIDESKNNQCLDWISIAKKDFIVSLLVQKKWSARSATDLHKFKIDELRDKLKISILQNATQQEIQIFEEKVISERFLAEEGRLEKLEESRKYKNEILQQGLEYFTPGAVIYIFDEIKLKSALKPHPIRARVIQQTPDGKQIQIEFLDTRPWYEAGGHMIHRGQKMNFKFEPITCKWLREGLTAEVVRSYGHDNKSEYFQLSYTRQYLLLPSEHP